jgi:hypothetical protein
MAEDDELAVTLGEEHPVEGAPLARVSARLMWGIEKSAIERREGDTVIRTPDGPRELADVLGDVDRSYFPTRQAFEDAVREVIGTGPIPTEDEDESDDEAEESDAEAEESDEQGEAEESDAEAEESDEQGEAEESDEEGEVEESDIDN